MKSVASAPGKIILFGEHFVVYGVKAILCSIDKRIIATSQCIDEKIIKIKSSLGESSMKLDALEDLDNISPKFMKPFFYIIQKTMKERNENTGIEVVLESQIPAGVGLGSSSAACVAVTASVNGLFGKLTREEVLKIAIEAERTIFEQNSGADASISVFGGLASYDRSTGFHNILSKSNLNFIISNSGQTHNTEEVVQQVKNFKEKNESLFFNLCKQEEEIIRNATVALEKNNINELGLLMSKNHELLKKIGVSTEKIDLMINEAKLTSYGAKITGAGGGGCTISLVDDHNSKKTLNNLQKISDCFITRIDHSGLRYEQS
jgi:mevalonate kinase